MLFWKVCSYFPHIHFGEFLFFQKLVLKIEPCDLTISIDNTTHYLPLSSVCGNSFSFSLFREISLICFTFTMTKCRRPVFILI